MTGTLKYQMDYLNAVSSYNNLSPFLSFITSTAKSIEEKSAVLSGHNDTCIFLTDLLSVSME